MFGKNRPIPKTQRKVGLTMKGWEFVEANKDYWGIFSVLASYGELQEREIALKADIDNFRVRKILEFYQKRGYVRYGPAFS